ncbi:MAG: hypothetical protein IT379_42250 [Deltaproteobacteria bacterium]|nr:hypothetical protein [Deltaproteobacteria bacterium]
MTSDKPLAVGAGLCDRCATGGFCSGCETGAVARAFWEGVMDELAYYDRALTLEEIEAHHERGRTP